MGVSEIKNDHELKKFLKEYNYNQSIIIQEKIVGKVFNIDLIFFNKSIIKHAYTERFFYKNFKASFSIEHKNNDKFKSYFEQSIKICKKIGINSGPVTLDFIERDGNYIY